MSVSSMVDQLASLPLEEIDAEIAATKTRLDLLQRMRAIVGGKPAPTGRGGRRAAPSAPVPLAEIDESRPFDDESIDRCDRVRRFLQIKGPAKANAIAQACGIPLGSITAVLGRTTGIAKNEDGCYALIKE